MILFVDFITWTIVQENGQLNMQMFSCFWFILVSLTEDNDA